MKEIIMELEILKTRIEKYSDEPVTFSKLIYTITNKMNRTELFGMTDEELIKHIQKLQILES